MASAASCDEIFPGVPIVAGMKTMDGGYLEAEMMAGAGATHVVVSASATKKRSAVGSKRGVILVSKVM